MKSNVLKWGVISGLILFAGPLLSFLVMGEEQDYDTGEIIGFTLIFLALGFIILGIRSYRAQNSGSITFGQAFKLGLLITLFPAVGFVASNWVYIEYLDPEFMDNYYEYKMEQAKGEKSEVEFSEYAAKMEAEKAMFTSPIAQAITYFSTVFLMGLVVSLIAALVMKKKFTTGVE